MSTREWRSAARRVCGNLFLFGIVGPVLGALTLSLAMFGLSVSHAASPGAWWQAAWGAVLLLIAAIVSGGAFLLGGPPALATAVAMGLLQRRITRRRHCLWIALIGLAAGALYGWCLLGELRLISFCSGPAALGCALISRKAYAREPNRAPP